MDSPLRRGQPDRGKINMSEDHEVRHWCKHLGIPRDELQKVVDKVGSSVKAVEKELGVHNASSRLRAERRVRDASEIKTNKVKKKKGRTLPETQGGKTRPGQPGATSEDQNKGDRP